MSTSILPLVIRVSAVYSICLRRYSIRFAKFIFSLANALKNAHPTYFWMMDINDRLSPTSPEPRTRTLTYRKVGYRIVEGVTSPIALIQGYWGSHSYNNSVPNLRYVSVRVRGSFNDRASPPSLEPRTRPLPYRKVAYRIG